MANVEHVVADSGAFIRNAPLRVQNYLKKLLVLFGIFCSASVIVVCSCNGYIYYRPQPGAVDPTIASIFALP